MTETGVRDAINDLMADYCHYLDDNRLEEWLDFFTEDCQYKILSRENVEDALPLELISCRNKNMLRDRILSLREANIYNIHFDKHLLGAVRMLVCTARCFRQQRASVAFVTDRRVHLKSS